MTTDYEFLKIVRYEFIPELFIALCDHSSVREQVLLHACM